MIAKWPLEVEIAMGAAPMPISVSSGHFALRYEVPKFLPRGGHLCMAVLTIAAVPRPITDYRIHRIGRMAPYARAPVGS